MLEEQFESRTEVVLSRLPVARKREPVLGAASVAQRPDLAGAALRRERVELVLAELALLGRGHQVEQVGLVDVPDLVARLHVVVATVQVAVVLQRRAETAGGRVDAQEMAAEIGFERHVEELHVDLAHVAAHPFLEHVHQEAAVLLRADRALGDQISGLGVEQPLPAWLLAPALVGDLRASARSRAR